MQEIETNEETLRKWLSGDIDFEFILQKTKSNEKKTEWAYIVDKKKPNIGFKVRNYYQYTMTFFA